MEKEKEDIFFIFRTGERQQVLFSSTVSLNRSAKK